MICVDNFFTSQKTNVSSLLSRPNFDKALERVRRGETGGIVVAKLDRFSRAGVADALKLIESIEGAGAANEGSAKPMRAADSAVASASVER